MSSEPHPTTPDDDTADPAHGIGECPACGMVSESPNHPHPTHGLCECISHGTIKEPRNVESSCVTDDHQQAAGFSPRGPTESRVARDIDDDTPPDDPDPTHGLRECPWCAYSLHGHGTDGVCPECGEPFDELTRVWRRDHSRSVLLANAVWVVLNLASAVFNGAIGNYQLAAFNAGVMVLLVVSHVLARLRDANQVRVGLSPQGIRLHKATKALPWQKVRLVRKLGLTGRVFCIRKGPLSLYELGIYLPSRKCIPAFELAFLTAKECYTGQRDEPLFAENRAKLGWPVDADDKMVDAAAAPAKPGRAGRRACPHCAHSLRELALEGACPECGTRYDCWTRVYHGDDRPVDCALLVGLVVTFAGAPCLVFPVFWSRIVGAALFALGVGITCVSVRRHRRAWGERPYRLAIAPDGLYCRGRLLPWSAEMELYPWHDRHQPHVYLCRTGHRQVDLVLYLARGEPSSDAIRQEVERFVADFRAAQARYAPQGDAVETRRRAEPMAAGDR